MQGCFENFLRTSNEISSGFYSVIIYVIYYVTYSAKIQVNYITLFLVSGLLSQFISLIVSFIVSPLLSVISIFLTLCFCCVPFLRFKFKQVVKYDQM